MSQIDDLIQKIIAFRDARDWKQFHTPKDLAISLLLESAEVAEHFQWKSDAEISEHLQKHKSDVAAELADVLYWVLLMSHDYKIDIAEALAQKLDENEKKYPISKSRGQHKKYTDLQ